MPQSERSCHIHRTSTQSRLTLASIVGRALILCALLFPFLSCGNEKPTLSLWIGGAPEEVNYLDSLVHKFEAQTGYRVEIVRQPTDSDQRRQELVVPLQSGQHNPDVFLMDVVWVGQFVSSDWLQPLNDYWTSLSDSLKHFFQPVIQQVDLRGDSLYALPLYVDGGLLYYRNDLLQRYGFTGPPQTWNELRDWSQEIQQKERDSNPDFYGFVWQGAQYEGLVCDFLEFAASAGGGFSEGGKIVVDQPANVKALQFMYDLIHEYKISPPSTYTEMKEEEVRRWFQRGNALFERNWPYAWKLHQAEYSPVRGKVAVSPLPHFEGEHSASTLGGWHVGMSRFSDDKSRAAELIHFLVSYDTQKKLALNLGWNPGRSDVYSDPEVLKKMPQLAKLQTVFESAVARPNLPYYSQISKVIQRYANECLAGEENPEVALSQMQNQIDEVVNAYQAK
jgi:multiple sugar transport system substrate-binding protein